MIRPRVEFLTKSEIEKIIDEALELLGTAGVFIENGEALKLLENGGQKIDRTRKQAFISRNLIEACLKTTPPRINLYDLSGKKQYLVGGDEIHFTPASAAFKILDSTTLKERPPVTDDLVNLYKLVECLENLDFQSTALVSSDVPQEIADCYRLYLGLLFGHKPFVTGIFREENLRVMIDLLKVVRGDGSELALKPLAVFDACPTSPLKWSNLTARSLIDCARSGIPSELVPMALTGATSPVTLAGTLVQHTAENLSGLVICQLAASGSPVIFGGASASFDMRKGTTPMGAAETMILGCACSQIGKYLNLPTHYYLGLSDAKIVDGQAGLETASGAVLAGLAGINIVAGPGMLDFITTQSLEKLVIDNEICGQVLRLIRGVSFREDLLAVHLFQDTAGAAPEFLSLPHTMKWYRLEHQLSSIFDRDGYDGWVAQGRRDIFLRAREEVVKKLNSYPGQQISPDKAEELQKIMTSAASAAGCSELPDWKNFSTA